MKNAKCRMQNAKLRRETRNEECKMQNAECKNEAQTVGANHDSPENVGTGVLISIRSRNGSCIINAIHYRSAASLPRRSVIPSLREVA